MTKSFGFYQIIHNLIFILFFYTNFSLRLKNITITPSYMKTYTPLAPRQSYTNTLKKDK